jgi:tripartite ATP-independent transporter DctM subunit
MGGMVPGIMLAAFLCVYIAIIAKKRNYPRSNAIKLREYLKFLVKAIWALLTPVILLGCVYTGVTTPTEAGAVAGLYTIIISVFLYKTLGWKDLKQILFDTVKGTGGVTIMIGAAATISFIFAKEGLGVTIGNWLLSICANKYSFLILTNIVVLLLGMFVDTSVIQLIMIPILWPVAQQLGIDVVHFGLIFTFNTMLGLSTPPFGMLLFITSSTSGTPLKKIIKEIMWPIIVMLLELILITFVPDIVLFLPKMFGLM